MCTLMECFDVLFSVVKLYLNPQFPAVGVSSGSWLQWVQCSGLDLFITHCAVASPTLCDNNANWYHNEEHFNNPLVSFSLIVEKSIWRLIHINWGMEQTITSPSLSSLHFENMTRIRPISAWEVERWLTTLSQQILRDLIPNIHETPISHT